MTPQIPHEAKEVRHRKQSKLDNLSAFMPKQTMKGAEGLVKPGKSLTAVISLSNGEGKNGDPLLVFSAMDECTISQLVSRDQLSHCC